MKKFVAILTIFSSLIVFSAGAATQSHGHKYKRNNHHYKAHKVHKPHGRIDATYQN